MNRNTRMILYLFFAVGLVFVMMDCSRRMQRKARAGNSAPESTTEPASQGASSAQP